MANEYQRTQAAHAYRARLRTALPSLRRQEAGQGEHGRLEWQVKAISGMLRRMER